ncbi:hypothetical protein VTJ49DRAFT_5058 [Mycothermus thermophilus]|uniref:DUF6594 domain-containing protein n=1 Tax=Humicola insolens TaxID=85995 RepID=A0ABR3V408_HUMIN
MSFAELQRMRLRELQCKLVKSMVDMRIDPQIPVDWEGDLKEYSKHLTPRMSRNPRHWIAEEFTTCKVFPNMLCHFNEVQAVRDYDFMTECSQRDNDPFAVTAERVTDDEIMQRAAWIRNVWQTDRDYEGLDPIEPLKTRFGTESWESERNPIGGTRYDSERMKWYTGFYKRLWFSLFGGAFLLAPMWIMVLHTTRNTCLITTTVFVVAFGTILAWRVEKLADVLTGTLAYAAVLVVFVGLAIEGEGAVEVSVAESRFRSV